MSRADVVICAYDPGRRELLARAVASASAAAEVIVVIDHSPTLLEWAEAVFPEARVIPNVNERGLAGARTTGVAAARAEIVAFLDDDAEAEPGWLERLTRHYDDPAVAGAGGSIVPVWDRPSWFPEEFDWVVGCTYRGLEPGPVRNLIGANMSLRRELILAAGGFASGLGRVGGDSLGCEETDLCLRIARCHPGTRFVHDPAAVVQHHVSPDRARLRYFVSRCFGEGRSKRMVVAREGADRGLASERAHLRGALLAGMRRGPARAAAIIVGVAAAGAGYASGGRA